MLGSKVYCSRTLLFVVSLWGWGKASRATCVHGTTSTSSSTPHLSAPVGGEELSEGYDYKTDSPCPCPTGCPQYRLIGRS